MSAGSRSGDVAVIIPARDEAARIQATVAAAAGLPGVAFVVVVDDGSRDATAELAAARGRGGGAAREEPRQGRRHGDRRGRGPPG